MPTAICNYFKTIITTDTRPLYIRTINNAPQPTRQQQGTTLIYSWENPTPGNTAPSSNAPSWYEDDPTVYVTEFASWKDVIHWGLQTFNNYHYPLSPELKQKIALSGHFPTTLSRSVSRPSCHPATVRRIGLGTYNTIRPAIFCQLLPLHFPRRTFYFFKRSLPKQHFQNAILLHGHHLLFFCNLAQNHLGSFF